MNVAKQLMIYDRVVPVSSARHKELSFDTEFSYSFAREIRAIPLVAEEIPHAAREYAIVFGPTDSTYESVIPFAITGFRENENTYVSDAGEWLAKYIPAFIRRYPFVFSTTSNDPSKFTLCIDESWDGCNREGRGQRLFDEQGERTAYLERLLKFNEEFQRSSQRTHHFCQKLQHFGLLDMKEATLSAGQAKEELKLKGFMVISREKLNALPAESLSEIVKSGVIELAYAHLHSLQNLKQMGERVVSQHANVEASPVPQG